MQWLDVDTDNCSIKRTLGVIGEKWTIVVLREAFNGVRRFDQIRAHTGIAESLLADRLRTLVTAEILEPVPYQEPGHRRRREYRLTGKGLDLYPVIIALLQWGDRYLADPEGPSVVVTHRDCGQPVEAAVTCAAGHQLRSAAEGAAAAGPGARAA